MQHSSSSNRSGNYRSAGRRSQDVRRGAGASGRMWLIKITVVQGITAETEVRINCARLHVSQCVCVCEEVGRVEGVCVSGAAISSAQVCASVCECVRVCV